MQQSTDLKVPGPSSKHEGDTASSTMTLQEKEEEPGMKTEEGPTAVPDAERHVVTADPTLDSPATVDEVAENTDYVSGFKLILLLFGIITFFFLVLLDLSIISTAIPQITSDFHSLPDIGWYSGAYQLASATLQPLTGKIYTFVKVKWVLLFFFFIFEVGSLLCAVSTSSTMFILGRAVAGIGSSGLSNGALTVIAGAVPLHKRPIYIGIMMGIGQMGLIAGPLIGGAFTQYVNWRWCFWINLPLGGASGLLLAFLHMPDVTEKPQVSFSVLREIIPRLDLSGFAIFAPASVMFLLALQFGSSEYPWNSSTVIGLFVGAGVTLPIFLYWEHRKGDEAMIPFSVMGKRVVWTSCLQGGLLMTSVFVGAQFLPIYFQSVKGVGPTLSGVYLLPNILSGIMCIVLSGVLVTKLGHYALWAVLAGSVTAVAGGLMSTWRPDTETAKWIGYQILYGARGLGLQSGVVALQNNLPPSQSALGLAFLIFTQNFASAIFSVVGNVIFTQTLLKQMASLAPSVNPNAALAAGGSAAAVRALVPPGSPELGNVILAYSNAFDSVCYMLLSLAILSSMAASGMGFADVRKKKEPGTGEA
ncbi:putative MFS multidrug transporter [Hypoxylon sp. NC1633]|nr:putative MFS multidrug transporter [Hypoxylon sp. NC1633]